MWGCAVSAITVCNIKNKLFKKTQLTKACQLEISKFKHIKPNFINNRKQVGPKNVKVRNIIWIEELKFLFLGINRWIGNYFQIFSILIKFTYEFGYFRK